MQNLQQALDAIASIIDEGEQIHEKYNARRAASRATESADSLPKINRWEREALRPLWTRLRGACKRLRPFLGTLSDEEALSLEGKIHNLDARYERLVLPGNRSLLEIIQG